MAFETATEAGSLWPAARARRSQHCGSPSGCRVLSRRSSSRRCRWCSRTLLSGEGAWRATVCLQTVREDGSHHQRHRSSRRLDQTPISCRLSTLLLRRLRSSGTTNPDTTIKQGHLSKDSGHGSHGVVELSVGVQPDSAEDAAKLRGIGS